MTLAPDPVDSDAPRDPALYGRRRLLGPGFWALIAFGLVCVAAGAALARFGPTWFSRDTAPPAIRQPAATIGQTAAELLMKRIEDGTRPISEICLIGELVERGSSRRTRGAR